MFKIEKPELDSKLHYFMLSRKFNSCWLKLLERRYLNWYLDKYEKIQDHREYNEDVIKLKK